MNPVKVELDYFAFAGGINEVTPAIAVPAGQLFFAQNYEPDINGGYRLAGGAERFDGRPRPSDASYTLLACTMLSTPASGATIVIGAATCRFVGLVTGGILVTSVTGTIPASTSMTVSAVPVGTTSSDTALSAPSVKEDAEHNLAAQGVYRSDIAAVPGSGSIRGVWLYAGVVYAFRDNALATACVMHKSTSGGWSEVTLPKEISFSNANTSVTDGDTLTQGGVTATVAKVVVETGSLVSGTNTGRLIITGVAGGAFAAGAATSTGGGSLTLSGAASQITLSAGGRYRFCNFNFYGQQSSIRMYGCNGLNRAFEFDGTTLIPINTGAATDTPSYVVGNRAYLYLAQGSSLMNSSVGEPLRYVAAEGAAEIGVGDTITGLVAMTGEAVGVMCKNSTYALTGADPSTWSLQVIRSDTGAKDATTVAMSDTYMLDDRGVISLTSTNAYGNFLDAVLSRLVQTSVTQLLPLAITAYANRTKGHYVILGSDGSGLVMGISQGKPNGFTTIKYPFNPTCSVSGEDSSGIERIFVGASNGYVYELNRGTSFDGAAIEAFCKVFFSHSRSPRLRKRYRRCVLDISNLGYSELSFQPEFSYGSSDTDSHRTQSLVANGLGGAWDISAWDAFAYDGQASVNQPNLSIEGTGVNVALIFYSNTALDAGHVLQGAMVHYSPRRMER